MSVIDNGEWIRLNGPIWFCAIPDDPHTARRLLSERLQEIGDEVWRAMRKLRGWDEDEVGMRR